MQTHKSAPEITAGLSPYVSEMHETWETLMIRCFAVEQQGANGL